MTVRETVTFQLNGREVTALKGEPILEIAKREGIDIPHLCYKPGLDAVGNCRACMVEIDGERSLSVVTFMPGAALRQHDGASVRSPSISTMQARQLPTASSPGL
jgi:formate dehydrogenase major subunit